MTDLIPFGSAQLELRFSEEASYRLTVRDLGAMLRRVQSFFNVSFWAAGEPYVDYDSWAGYDYRYELRERLVVDRLTYESPVDIAVAITTASSAVTAAVAGAIKVKTMWDQHRVNHAAANYKIDAVKVLRDGIPGVNPPQPRGDSTEIELAPPGEVPDLPREREVSQAARILRDLDVIRVIQGGGKS